MHALDHLVLEAFGAAGGSFQQAPRAVELRFGGGKGAVAGLDLVGVDQTLAVEAEVAAFGGLGGETVGSLRPLKTPSNTAIPAARAARTID